MAFPEDFHRLGEAFVKVETAYDGQFLLGCSAVFGIHRGGIGCGGCGRCFVDGFRCNIQFNPHCRAHANISFTAGSVGKYLSGVLKTVVQQIVSVGIGIDEGTLNHAGRAHPPEAISVIALIQLLLGRRQAEVLGFSVMHPCALCNRIFRCLASAGACAVKVMVEFNGAQ